MAAMYTNQLDIEERAYVRKKSNDSDPKKNASAVRTDVKKVRHQKRMKVWRRE